jgi:hypothetical protein
VFKDVNLDSDNGELVWIAIQFLTEDQGSQGTMWFIIFYGLEKGAESE